MHHFALWASDVHTFWPVIDQPPSTLVARVFSAGRSEPASGSEKPWHQISPALRMGSSRRRFCSSVPWRITTGPPISRPRPLTGSGAPAPAISSSNAARPLRLAPPPPPSPRPPRPPPPPPPPRPPP